MYQSLSILAIIPARGGSKRIPRKNVRPLNGKPLIAWTIEAAQSSKLVDRLILSSDDEEIMEVSRNLGCEVPFVRPATLARDDSSGMDPVLHALTELPGFDIVALLQPTSPLRHSEDIDGCVRLMVSANRPCCVSVTELGFDPLLLFERSPDHSLLPAALQGTQQNQLCRLNGAVYAARTDWLMEKRRFLTGETVGYPMPLARSVDIDTEYDFLIARMLMEAEDEEIQSP